MVLLGRFLLGAVVTLYRWVGPLKHPAALTPPHSSTAILPGAGLVNLQTPSPQKPGIISPLAGFEQAGATVPAEAHNFRRVPPYCERISNDFFLHM